MSIVRSGIIRLLVPLCVLMLLDLAGCILLMLLLLLHLSLNSRLPHVIHQIGISVQVTARRGSDVGVVVHYVAPVGRGISNRWSLIAIEKNKLINFIMLLYKVNYYKSIYLNFKANSVIVHADNPVVDPLLLWLRRRDLAEMCGELYKKED